MTTTMWTILATYLTITLLLATYEAGRTNQDPSHETSQAMKATSGLLTATTAILLLLLWATT